MLRIRWIVVFVSGLLALIWFTTTAYAQDTGSTTWTSWRFDWEVRDFAGIAIRNVYFNNEQVIYKASLPSIRVKYANNACGPYLDRIYWENLLPISNCGNNKVCQKSYTIDGRQWLELGVLAKIGEYIIYQVWYLSDDGYMNARMFSRGLQCIVDHDHHPYWRIDFDINDSSGDQVFVYDTNRPDEGWGPGWHKHTQEVNELKNPPTNRYWFVRDNLTAHGVSVLPGPDGVADSFSSLDVGVRRYQSAEDGPWSFGVGELGYLNGEDVQETDDVLWYAAHLFHRAADGPNQWEWVGPVLKVHR